MNGRTALKCGIPSGRRVVFLVRVPKEMFPGESPPKVSFGQSTGTQGFWKEDLGDGRTRHTRILKYTSTRDPNLAPRKEGVSELILPKCTTSGIDDKGNPFEEWTSWEASTWVTDGTKTPEGKTTLLERGEPPRDRVEAYIAWFTWTQTMVLGYEGGPTGNAALDRLHTIYGDKSWRRAVNKKNGGTVVGYAVTPGMAGIFASQLASIFKYAKARGYRLRLLGGWH